MRLPILRHITFLVALGIFVFPYAAYAQQSGTSGNLTAGLPSDECALTASAQSCPGNANQAITTANSAALCTTNCSSTYYDGVRSDPGTAGPAIDAWNFCRYVDNSSTNSYFVPFHSAVEWGADITSPYGFVKNPPPHVNLATCSRPGSIPVPDDFPTDPTGAVNPWYDASFSCDVSAFSNPAASLPYGRTGSQYPAPPATFTSQFTCTVKGQCDVNDPTNCGADQQWILTASTTFVAGVAPDNASRPTSGGWAIGNIVYSGNKPAPNPPANLACNCGPAAGIATPTPPSSGLCGTGEFLFIPPNQLPGIVAWSWECISPSCAALSSGQSPSGGVQCSTPPYTDTAGQCGATQDSCTTGTYAGDDSNDGTNYHWTCDGTNGGANASCAAPMAIAGQCGPANGVASASAPASGLCSDNSTPAVSGGGASPWTWTCTGLNGGTNASCAAPLPSCQMVAMGFSQGGIIGKLDNCGGWKTCDLPGYPYYDPACTIYNVNCNMLGADPSGNMYCNTGYLGPGGFWQFDGVASYPVTSGWPF